jgi:pimeloyl-ACP methyl ester carboxylesterase
MSNAVRDLIVLRHGINSSPESMEFLREWLERVEGSEPQPEMNNEAYAWKRPVLEQGIAFARRIIELYRPEKHRRIILIGHSQGGLLCRVAAVLLAGRSTVVGHGLSAVNASAFGRDVAQLLATWTSDDRTNATRVAPALAGLVMLATPNAGAFTFGQLSLLGRLSAAGLRGLVSPFGVRDLPDLMTDRLPRLLQHYRVGSIKYVSISGSAVSRYSGLQYEDLADLPYLGRLGVRLELPNDSVVEDVSVDLANGPLPCEIEDLAAQYEHVRAYIDCTAVAHTSIHSAPEVAELVKHRLRKWLALAASVTAPSPPDPAM